MDEGLGPTVTAEKAPFLVEKKRRPLGVIAAAKGPSLELSRAKPILALRFRAPILPDGAIRAS